MILINLLLIAVGGFCLGILTVFLGVGGGTVLVPLLVALGYTPIQAVATSALAITITALSGTLQNWRMGYIKPRHLLYLGIPALIFAQIGVYLSEGFSAAFLLFAFGLLLVLNIFLIEFRKLAITQHKHQIQVSHDNNLFARITTGGTAGVLAGLFGVDGGVIMVPLQIIWLGEPIKAAIRTSLGVIVLTAISACVGHALQGNVLFEEGVLLGTASLIGAQVSTRFLPQLSSKVISFAFRNLLTILAIYIFWQSWEIYQGLQVY